MNHSFLEEDPEYPDLNCEGFVVRRYLRLIDSADYRSKPFIYQDPSNAGFYDAPFPPNLLTEGRKLTPYLRIKISGALALCPLPSTFEVRVYQLFHLMKLFGWRYNYKLNCWEQDWNCR